MRTRPFRYAALAMGALWLAAALTGRAAWPLAPLATLAVALGALAAYPRAEAMILRALLALPPRAFTAVCAAAAAGSSLWLVRGPLRDRPLAIDAAVYLMQARALASGHFGMPTEAPLLHASARFLLEGADGQLHGVFPPGYPAALAPFALVGAEMLSGPVIAALLVVAQSSLARSAFGTRDELARRVSLLFGVASFARAMETADLLSHALVALLVTWALAILLRPRRALPAVAALALGACVGLGGAARLLDGAVLGLGALAVLARRRDARGVLLAGLGAAPFAALLLLEQRAATGGWLRFTQSVYFARSDWPPGCHALGFGRDVGCTIEHALWMPLMGGDGYGPLDAVRVLRERSVAFGRDLFGAGPLMAFVFALAARRPRAADVCGGAFAFAFALAYGLFYFGNVPFYGARHLFPVAPLAWVLAARALAHVWPRRRGLLVAAALASAAVGQGAVWRAETRAVSWYQRARLDLRRAAALKDVSSGIVYAPDVTGVVAAFDPRADAGRLYFVQDDHSGLLELRRAHPELPVYKALDTGELAQLVIGAPAPGLLVELERAWPSFQRPSGAAAQWADAKFFDLPASAASGHAVLYVTHAAAGATIDVPFALARAGTFSLRLDGLAGPRYGDWDIELDGARLGVFRGYAPELGPRKGEPLGERSLAPGRHALRLRCTGKDAASERWDGAFDALVGVP